MTTTEVETERVVTQTEEMTVCDDCNVEIEDEGEMVEYVLKKGTSKKITDQEESIHYHAECARENGLVTPTEAPSFREATDDPDYDVMTGTTLAMNGAQQFVWLIGFGIFTYGLSIYVDFGLGLLNGVSMAIGIILMFTMWIFGRKSTKRELSEFDGWDW